MSDTISAVGAISSFALSGVAQPTENVFVLTSIELQAIIEKAVMKATEPLEAKLQALENDLKKYHIFSEVGRIEDLWNWVEDIEKELLRRRQSQPSGFKTIVRIKKLDEILKSRGPQTFGELEDALKINSATMTRLLSKLDMRRYEVFYRPGNKREKVLSLKAQFV